MKLRRLIIPLLYSFLNALKLTESAMLQIALSSSFFVRLKAADKLSPVFGLTISIT